MSKNVIARNVIPAKAGTHDNRSNLLFYLFPLLFLLSTSCTTPSTSPEGLSIPIPSRWSQDLNAQATPWLAAQLRVYELPTQTKVHATTMQVDETTGTVKAKSFKLPGGKTYKFIIEFQYLSQGSAIAFAYAEVEKEIGDGNAETVSFTSSDIRYEVDKQDPSISASISQGILPDLDPDNDGWSTYQELKDKVSPTDKTSVPQPPTLKITTTQQGTDLLITLEGEDNAHVEEMKLTDPICGVTKLSEVTGSANGKVTKQIVYRLDLLSVNKDLSSRQLLATVEDGVTAIQGKDEKASLTLDSNLSHPTFAFSDPEEGTELEGTQTLKGIACARQGVQGVTLKYNGEVLAGDTTEKNENILWEMETTFNQLNTELLPDGVVQLEVEVVDKASNSGLGKGQYSVVNTSAIKVVSPKGRKWIFGNEEIEFNVVNQPQVSLVSIKGPIGKLKPIAKNPASASSTLGVSGMEEGEPVTVTVVTEQVDGKPGPSRPVTFKVRNKPNIKIFKSGDLWNGWEGSLQYEVENVNPTTLMIDDQTIITDSEKQCSVNENITTCKGSFKVKPQVSTKYTLKASRLATTEEKCDKQCDVAQDFTPTIMAFDGDVPRYGVDTTESFTLPGNNSKEYRVRAIELDNNGQETTTIPIDEKKSGGESLPLSNLKPRKDYKFKVEETSGAQILNTLEKIVTTGDTGLVLWLRFNEDPSKSIMCEGDDNPSKTICDYSGNSNHGIPQGGPQWLEPPQSGILDGAFKFDGTNDQVLIDNVSALNPDSVSVIAVVTNIDKYSEQQLVDKRLDGATYNLRLAGDGFYPLYVQFVILSSVQDYYHMTSDRLINNDIPYHIAGTFDHATGEVGIYLNGEPVTTYLDLVPVDTIGQIDRSVKSTSKLFIGNNSYGNANYFSGNMSEIFIFDRPLSAEEVNKYYLSTSGD